jgi:hypothetical protein
MTGFTQTIGRTVRALVVCLAAGTLLAPTALADKGLVDDWFRDARPVPVASIGLIDVTARESSRPVASPATAASRLATGTDSGFAWGEFGIGAAAMLGAVLVLVGIGLGAQSARHRSGSLRTS